MTIGGIPGGPSTWQFRSKDHPECGGRKPLHGEHGYTLTFPLEHGDTLIIQCGEETLQHFSQMLGSLLIDTEAERG